MDRPLIVYFSQEKNNLERLLFELHNYYESPEKLISFQDMDLLLNALQNKNINREEIRFFILDINNADYSTISFINQINQYCENSILIIIGENSTIIEIINRSENKTGLQFLSRPWNRTDFILAINIATSTNEHLLRKSKSIESKNNIQNDFHGHFNRQFKELIDSNMAKDKFLSIIAHDLKSPFAALLGISEVILNNWDDINDETKLDLVSDIKRTSETTFKLLEDLLIWAKNQKEKLEVCIEEINVDHILSSAVRLAENSAKQKNIVIKTEVYDDLKVLADKNMISTVFRNLITNAVKFIQPGGIINITAEKDMNFCTFCVADNGNGIDKPHILELFKSGKPKKLNGNVCHFQGLGLLLCKEFVELNGGTIWLETKKNEGSRFYFTIPC